MILLIFLIHPVKTTQFFEDEMLAPVPLPLERVSRTREILVPSTPNSHCFFIKVFRAWDIW